MADKTSQSREPDLQQVAEEVALGASRLALIAGIIAVGASFLAGEKTQAKIANETSGVLGNFRRILSLFSTPQIEEKSKK